MNKQCPYPLQELQRIEAIETELTKFNALRSLTGTERRLEEIRDGDCTLLRDRTDPGSPYYNRIKGFGAPAVPELDRLLEQYEKPPCIDMSPNRLTEDASTALCDRGYRPVEQLVFLSARPPYAQPEEAEYVVEKVTDRNAEEFIRWIGRSSGGIVFERGIVDRVKAYFYDPRFYNVMLSIGGEPAAMGSMFVHGREGYLANDYTFEAFRGRGCQRALIRHRLAVAAERGLEAVYTDVEYGSISHANMEKSGFRTAFLNTFWMKS